MEVFTGYWMGRQNIDSILNLLYIDRHIRNFFKYMPIKVSLDIYFPEFKPWNTDSIAFEIEVLGNSLDQVIRAKNQLRWIAGCREIEEAYNSLNICEKIKYHCAFHPFFVDHSPVPICEIIRKYCMSFPIIVKLIKCIYSIDDVIFEWIYFLFFLIIYYIIFWYEKDH